jgi:hypothetical protein
MSKAPGRRLAEWRSSISQKISLPVQLKHTKSCRASVTIISKVGPDDGVASSLLLDELVKTRSPALHSSMQLQLPFRVRCGLVLTLL